MAVASCCGNKAQQGVRISQQRKRAGEQANRGAQQAKRKCVVQERSTAETWHASFCDRLDRKPIVRGAWELHYPGSRGTRNCPFCINDLQKTKNLRSQRCQWCHRVAKALLVFLLLWAFAALCFGQPMSAPFGLALPISGHRHTATYLSRSPSTPSTA